MHIIIILGGRIGLEQLRTSKFKHANVLWFGLHQNGYICKCSGCFGVIDYSNVLAVDDAN
jgi:hypothetical protein